MAQRKELPEMDILTQCCRAYYTFWEQMMVCRKCHTENPALIEVETSKPNQGERDGAID